MIIRYNKESKTDIFALRNAYYNSLYERKERSNKVDVLKKFLRKKRFKKFLLTIVTFGLSNYSNELIKLTRSEIKREKEQIKALEVEFGKNPSVVSQTLDKLSSLYNQLIKTKYFYCIDSTYFDFERLDTFDFDKKYFKLVKKNNMLNILDVNKKKQKDDYIYPINYEFNQMFIAKIDKPGALRDIYSYDDVVISTKSIDYVTNKKIKGLKLLREENLNQTNDKSYVYELKLVKVSFMDARRKEYTFLGSDIDKMNLFNNLLLEYLEFLKQVNFEIVNEVKITRHKNSDYYNLVTNNKEQDYLWIIFDYIIYYFLCISCISKK